MAEHRVGIALADVSGKGIAAALIMSVVQASLRIITSDGNITAPKLTAKLNQFLYRSTPASKYATFFYAEVDSRSHQLRYVNAGHNPPYLFRARPAGAAAVAGAGMAVAEGMREQVTNAAGQLAASVVWHGADVAVAAEREVEELSIGGMVVGMFPDADYEEGLVELRPRDVLIAFTDGVPEAHNPAGDEFGEERLKRVVLEGLELSAADIMKLVSAALKDWIQDAEQYDDLTFVVMKVT